MGVTSGDRVLSQLLMEMDGLQARDVEKDRRSGAWVKVTFVHCCRPEPVLWCWPPQTAPTV